MQDQTDAGTKDRLLKAARTVFAERGVKEATVREICARAGANVAAVNYYFGGKEKLFMAVLADYLHSAQEMYPTHMGLAPDASARDRLKAYIRSLLLKLAGDGDPLYERLGQLFTAEMIEPSEHFGAVADRYLMPQHGVLLGIVGELMPGTDERTVHLCAAGVLGHCLLFDHAKQLIRRMCPEMALENLGVELVANFVFNFALAGIERMKTFKG
ncbi:MAG: CerR family C-terminal domain-containing protein [Proteobacteria bacterium]|nr:CerR family C-terminal domain-containing protein [Pseudomonadota bacterium]MBU1594437.1 CerR family C-terminal domain-containing protein [Pseudomonadota bacterium]